VDLLVYQRLVPVYIVENQIGAIPSANCQPANAPNTRPRLAGKLQARLTKTAHLSTLPFERKKQSAPGRLVTGNIELVTAPRWFALYDLMMEKVANLNGLNKAGVSVRELGRWAG
jgi:hypothetical protein